MSEWILRNLMSTLSLGMHLLYYGGAQEALLQNKSVESILLDLTQKEGATFDDPASVKNIPSFIKTYSIQTDELRNPDLSSYKNFNEFFFRQLREDARPVQNEDDPFGFCSAADCRLTTYPTVDLARKFWVKGRNFTIPNLLGVATDSPQAQLFDNGSLAIFRLAPADYHRFHSPLDGEIGDYTTFPGQYYTVNPQAVNEPGFDVFTANHRSVLYMTHEATGSPIALVAIGAMLVGSIVWTNGAKKGAKVKKGEELGCVFLWSLSCPVFTSSSVILRMAEAPSLLYSPRERSSLTKTSSRTARTRWRRS
jgi:phosphatidylserine decarboxylase